MLYRDEVYRVVWTPEGYEVECLVEPGTLAYRKWEKELRLDRLCHLIETWQFSINEWEKYRRRCMQMGNFDTAAWAQDVVKKTIIEREEYIDELLWSV